jgi:aminotransferase
MKGKQMLNLQTEPPRISHIRLMTQECVKHSGINLGQGLCTLPPPPEVLEAAQRALTDGHNGYAPAQGIGLLRNAISQKLYQRNGFPADPESEILVTSGATGGYVAALKAIADPGDAIALIEPFYGYHRLIAEQERLKVVALSLDGPDEQITYERLASDLVMPIRAIVLCTPANPTGKVYTMNEIQAIARWASERQVWVITDETYEEYVYDGLTHVTPAKAGHRHHLFISVFSFSKTYSVPGWRLGYLVAPKQILPRITAVHDRFYICAPTPTQYAAVAALGLSTEYHDGLRKSFQDRRDALHRSFQQTTLRATLPKGAYYSWVDASGLGFASSLDTALYILKSAGVACVPGSAFHEAGRGEQWVRFCFAVPDADLSEAANRLATHLSPERITDSLTTVHANNRARA